MENDPGWPLPGLRRTDQRATEPFSLRRSLRSELPFIPEPDPAAVEAADINYLLTIRWLFCCFVVGAILLVPVSLLIVTRVPEPTEPMDGPVAIVLGVGVLALVALPRILPPLVHTDASTLVASYRMRFLLSIAVAEAPVLFGVVGVSMTGALWPIAVGLLISAVAFVRMAPTSRALQRIDDELRAQGSPLSLPAALQG